MIKRKIPNSLRTGLSLQRPTTPFAARELLSKSSFILRGAHRLNIHGTCTGISNLRTKDFSLTVIGPLFQRHLQ